MTPLILDLFCGQGGAAQGYIDAGFDVVGVDIADHGKRYPGTFVRDDAVEFLRANGHRFQFIHASPPCQSYSIATAGRPDVRDRYPRLIPMVRDALEQTDALWVIENVAQARGELRDPVLLCGRMFGLEADDEDGERLVLERHRLFETNFDLEVPEHPKHEGGYVAGVYGGSRRSSKPDATPADDRYAARHERKGGYVPRSKRVQQDLLGIDWMTVRGMQESIPPAYAEWIGRQMLYAVRPR